MDPSITNYAIIGAGPAGLLAALSIRNKILSRRDQESATYSSIKITIYERLANISQILGESYPIGINPRGLNALEILCNDAFKEVQRNGAVMNSFDIYSGSRNVASIACGTVLGHTRYGVTDALYQQAKKAGIEIKFGHKLIELDASKHVLTFQMEESMSNIIVDCSNTIVIAADGANSVTRRLLMAQAAASSHLKQSYSPKRFSFTPSDVKIRVLIVDGTERENVPLAPGSHSVYNNVYCALVGPSDDRRWRIAISVEGEDQYAELITMESNEPTPEDMKRLRSFIAERVPPLKETEKYFTDEEIRSFFSRRSFSPDLFSMAPFHYPHTGGKSSENNEMNDVDPWIVFLGDSAHCVFPSMGEGMNSCLEDVLVFNESVLSPAYDECLSIDLAAYTKARESDIDALYSLARARFFSHAGEPQLRATKMTVMIATSIARKLRLIGPQILYSTKVYSYQEIYSIHLKETALIRPLAKVLVGSFFWMKSVFQTRQHLAARTELQLQQPSMIKHQVGQKNTNHGWMYMSSYWMIGIVVLIAFGYTPSSWNAIASPFTSLHAISMAISLTMAKLFFDNATNFDRPKSWRSILASFIFAAVNGIIETILMLAAYDLGAVWLNSIISGTSAVTPAADALTAKAATLGFLTNYCYNGLIHVFFWLPKALPAHRRPGAKPFYVRGLPEVSFLSLTWLAVYVFAKDIAFVCVLHFLFNLHGGLVMGLQLPSLKQKGQNSKQW